MKKKSIVAMLCLALAAGLSACAQQSPDAAETQQGAEQGAIAATGDFQAKTVDGGTIDRTFFEGKKITMINIWATWCSPCVNEMPDLQLLSQKLEGSDAQVMTILGDAVGPDGKPVTDELLKAKAVLEKSGSTFPTAVPDAVLSETLMRDIQAFPTTYFVDSQGNVVGEPVLGARSADDWQAEIEKRLEEVADAQ